MDSFYPGFITGPMVPPSRELPAFIKVLQEQETERQPIALLLVCGRRGIPEITPQKNMEALIWIDRKMSLPLDRASQEASSPADNEGTPGTLTLCGSPWKTLSVYQCKKDRLETNPEQSRGGGQGYEKS